MPRLKASGREEEVLSEDDLVGADTQPAQQKAAKPRATAKTGTKRKAPVKQPRQALADRTNVLSTDDGTVEEDDLEHPKSKRTKAVELRLKPVAARDGISQHKESLAVIAETQRSPGVKDVARSSDKRKEPAMHQRSYNSAYTSRAGSANPSTSTHQARSGPVQPIHSVSRERSLSTERERRAGDIETRRQLTTVTRECESLTLKNQALEDLVRDKAESNFDKLKREADLKTKQADDLIASLKKELAVLRKSWNSTSSETQGLQSQLSDVSEAYELSKQESTRLDQELAATKQSLHAVENERKSLEAKLVAARQQLSNESVDAKSGNRNTGVKTTEAQREAKMKESLYTDLTGLIIRGVKRKNGEDEYDCIQTGRNGTLHFHLSVVNETSTSNPKTPGLSYEEAEFSYEPFLDESRDKDLLDILPDYLSEDICFPRNHAVKFYSKVVESMTKRIVLEEE